MAQNEQLREALLELSILRNREAMMLRETKTLLDCLESYSTAANPGVALASLFVSLSQKAEVDLSLAIQKTDQGHEIVASSDISRVGGDIIAPIDLFARPRNISDLSLTGDWHGPVDMRPYSGMIIAPAQDDMVLLALCLRPKLFKKHQMQLILRLAGLMAQAVQNRKIENENRLLAATIAGSSSGFAISDARSPQRPLVYVNKAFEAISGYTADEVLGKNCRFLTAEPENAPERIRLRQAVKDRRSGKFLLRNKRKSGEMFWNELTLFPVKDAQGQVRNLVATQSDVSDRVMAAQERDRVQARMERALAATEDAFVVIDQNETLVFANLAAADMFPARGVNWVLGSQFRDNWAAYLDYCKTQAGQVAYDLRHPDLRALARLPNGHEVDLPDGRSLLMRAAMLDDGGFVMLATDVTAMKSAQRLLAQRLVAMESATDGIAVCDAAGRLMYLNASAGALMGFRNPPEGIGSIWTECYNSPRGIDISTRFDVTLKRIQGRDVFTHEIKGSPLENGGAVLVIRDITRELAAEAQQEDMMHDLIQLQRQEAIAQLTAGVAHDFNNLLSAINGSVALIDMLADVPDAIAPHIRRIAAAGRQSAKLVNRLLDIGAGAQGQGVFDLGSALKDLPGILKPNLPDCISFNIEKADLAIALRGNSGALSQVLINLALNARDAIGGEKGEIRISVHTRLGRDIGAVHIGDIAPEKHYAWIEISDTGMGIDGETMANLFTPYFTTKGRQGTGLGLVTAAMQVKSVGGAMGVVSAQGQGTSFHIYWPVADAEQTGAKPNAPVGRNLNGMPIIIVDDDAQVAEVIASYLEAHGAEVAQCIAPQDAIDAIAETPEFWAALITDYDMSDINGGELAEKVGRIAPDLPIVVVTALARRLTDPRLTTSQVRAILPKPVDLDHLLGMLAELDVKKPKGGS